MQQEHSISKIGETAPDDFVERIPKLTVDGDLTLADVKNGLIVNQDIRQQLFSSGLNQNEIVDIYWSLNRALADLRDPMKLELFAHVDVSTLRHVEEDEFLEVMSSERDAKILKKLF